MPSSLAQILEALDFARGHKGDSDAKDGGICLPT
jgi:hypothetical protein